MLALPWLATGVMTVSGILYMGAMLFYLRAIQSEEASVVAPLFQANTLFTFALGWLFLHEVPRLVAAGGRGAGGGRRASACRWTRKLHFGSFKPQLVLLMLARHLRAGAVQRGVQILRRA